MPSVPDENWRWKLRLFASADLVGSTAYKVSQSKNKTPNWASTFREFFHDFPRWLENIYSKLPTSKHGECPKEKLKPWKFLGDECLFEVELKNVVDCAFHVLAFKRALHSFQWKDEVPLHLKGTLWIAGFPVYNREILLQSQERTITDYIGQLMDAGFRITKFSTETSIALSADLAYLLMEAVQRLEWKADEEKIFLRFRGCEPLKGVLDGKPYPVVHLHINDGKPTLEEVLLGAVTKTDWNELHGYLRGYVDTHLQRPFIVTDSDAKFNTVPDELAKMVDTMRAEEAERGFQQQPEAQAPKQSGDEKDIEPPAKRQ
jgi:hypothetical protein